MHSKFKSENSDLRVFGHPFNKIYHQNLCTDLFASVLVQTPHEIFPQWYRRAKTHFLSLPWNCEFHQKSLLFFFPWPRVRGSVVQLGDSKLAKPRYAESSSARERPQLVREIRAWLRIRCAPRNFVLAPMREFFFQKLPVLRVLLLKNLTVDYFTLEIYFLLLFKKKKRKKIKRSARE